MYTRETGNPSVMSSPVLAPTLVGDATASTNCRGDLSCDMGGRLLISIVTHLTSPYNIHFYAPPRSTTKSKNVAERGNRSNKL